MEEILFAMKTSLKDKQWRESTTRWLNLNKSPSPGVDGARGTRDSNHCPNLPFIGSAAVTDRTTCFAIPGNFFLSPLGVSEDMKLFQAPKSVARPFRLSLLTPTQEYRRRAS